jgi:nucleotide-binding universal stress UspA family protein/GNAT superfamily N-acetyltransferase
MIVTLRDGTEIDIRPIDPGDRDELQAGFSRLSPESRYRRFFGPMQELSERDLDYLTNVDHHDHEALVARDPRSGIGVGVARFVRIGPEVAEPAIVVADDWQGRGVGSRLLDALSERARAEHIRRFEAPVLATNHEAIRLLERLGETTRRNEGREVQLTIELPSGPGAGPRWHDTLRHFAAGVLEPARTLLELLWPRRRGAPDDERRNVIVVGIDGSETSDQALEAACALALASGATVEIVGAHRFLPPDQAEVEAAVRRAASTLRERGVEVREHLRRGDPSLVLTDVAAEQRARLIVVGAGQRAKSTRRLIGSVADNVAERSPCNVLIVRPRQPVVDA